MSTRLLQNIVAIANFIVGMIVLLIGLGVGMTKAGIIFIIYCSFVGTVDVFIQRHTGCHVGAKNAER